MVANKFATLLRRNTHRMTFLLIYMALEWILIALLLLNGLLSYIIFKFASFFGLKPPCVFCSRIDHVFERGKDGGSYRDLLCESHVGKLSKLGFCSIHRRLAEAGDMCEDCAASRPWENDRSCGLLSWMKRSEQGEKDLRCSCCGVVLENGFYSPFVKPEAWDVLDRKDKSVKRVVVEENGGGCGTEAAEFGKEVPSDYFDPKSQKLEEEGEEQEEMDDNLKGESFICLPVEKIEYTERILPIGLIDSYTMLKSRSTEDGSDHLELEEDATAKISPVPNSATVANEQIAALSCPETAGSDKNPIFEILTVLLPTEESHHPTSVATKVKLVAPEDSGDDEELQASEEHGKMNDDSTCEISIGSEICDQEQIEQALHEPLSQPEVTADLQLASFTESAMGDPEQAARRVKQLMVCPVLHDFEEERTPETPTTPNSLSVEAIAALHKRFLLERRESGTESLDGSIASDMDNLETLTADRLKVALRSERRIMSALYTELEEERSASAIAANQTMAMITRLQEEKAAVQMEALQYQRMMEEQSEYDQEALQVLNELMMKREKEKLELEKELELYRHKVHKYESMMGGKLTKGSMSDTSSTGEDSDALGFMEDDDRVNHCVTLHESMDEFEEERLAILGQLKALEEKLFTMEEEDVCFNSKPMEHLENGHERRRSSGMRRKNLLPLFDAISFESKVSINHLKLSIVEEVDNVYERLRDLEEDREFLKHCLSSLRKGDKGIDLLHEILHLLRDLRNDRSVLSIAKK